MAYTILGGRLSGPVDLSVEGKLPVSLETAQANCNACALRDLLGLQPFSKVGKRLAVVGGGPSINDHVEELQYWDAEQPGEVWAINGAWGWCEDRGIKATFFAIDAHPIVAQWPKASDGTLAKRAILSMTCDPSVFDLLKDAEVTAISHGRDGLRGGSSTAGLAPHLGALMGYSSITFFGCESSYGLGRTHAYMHEDRPEELIVAADGNDHLTAPDFMMQARELATFINATADDPVMPGYLSERSGGLLRAMIRDLKAGKEMSIRWMSDAVVAGLSSGPLVPNHGEGKVTADAVPVRQAAE